MQVCVYFGTYKLQSFKFMELDVCVEDPFLPANPVTGWEELSTGRK